MQMSQNLVVRLLLIGLSAFFLTLSSFSASLATAQSSGSGQRDCDDNAVLRCGAYSTSELKQKYNNQSGAKTIFSHFGISSSEINQMQRTAVNGYITRDNKVVVDGKTVATNAVTAGRHNMPGSKKVTKGGTTFYTRPPSVSFSQQRLEAYVVMKNNRFNYAVIKSCGNPVTATPKTPKSPPPATPQTPKTPPATPPPPPQTPPPPPAPPAPPAQPPAQIQVQQQQQQQTVVVETPVQVVEKEATPPPPPQPPAQPTVLPDTGVGQVLGASSAIGMASTFGYAFYRWLRVRFGLM